MAEGVRKENLLLTDEVRELLALLAQSDISELRIEHEGAKIHIKRATAQPAVPLHAATYTPVPVAPLSPPQVPPPAIEVVSHELLSGQTVNAPMVGTFYASPAPNEPPFVQEGEEIHPGMVVGIVEAMKMMNEIESDIAGRVVRVLVQNGQPIEYGQPLFVVEPL
jgi:acetyl-CoA carboxylase biotin carboxyl carrier protein